MHVPCWLAPAACFIGFMLRDLSVPSRVTVLCLNRSATTCSSPRRTPHFLTHDVTMTMTITGRRCRWAAGDTKPRPPRCIILRPAGCIRSAENIDTDVITSVTDLTTATEASASVVCVRYAPSTTDQRYRSTALRYNIRWPLIGATTDW